MACLISAQSLALQLLAAQTQHKIELTMLNKADMRDSHSILYEIMNLKYHLKRILDINHKPYEAYVLLPNIV